MNLYSSLFTQQPYFWCLGWETPSVIHDFWPAFGWDPSQTLPSPLIILIIISPWSRLASRELLHYKSKGMNKSVKTICQLSRLSSAARAQSISGWYPAARCFEVGPPSNEFCRIQSGRMRILSHCSPRGRARPMSKLPCCRPLPVLILQRRRHRRRSSWDYLPHRVWTSWSDYFPHRLWRSSGNLDLFPRCWGGGF